jgi:hypothetical protein
VTGLTPGLGIFSGEEQRRHAAAFSAKQQLAGAALVWVPFRNPNPRGTFAAPSNRFRGGAEEGLP